MSKINEVIAQRQARTKWSQLKKLVNLNPNIFQEVHNTMVRWLIGGVTKSFCLGSFLCQYLSHLFCTNTPHKSALIGIIKCQVEKIQYVNITYCFFEAIVFIKLTIIQCNLETKSTSNPHPFCRIYICYWDGIYPPCLRRLENNTSFTQFQATSTLRKSNKKLWVFQPFNK